MANEKQLALLKRSVAEWNAWRNGKVFMAGLIRTQLLDLSSADLNGVDLKDADLSDVDLRVANLSNADLSLATLEGASLKDANLSNAILCRASLRRADLKYANLNGADLSNAYLGDANLSSAYLRGADLYFAELRRAQALGTNFAGAILTGACIEDWNTNSETNFDGVICDYIYRKGNQQERHPAQGNFAPGDFARLFQKARETLDLIFREGIDWRSFADTLQEVRKEQVILEPDNPDANIALRAIETRDDGSFVIRVSVPDSLDKAKLEAQFQEKYAQIEASYRARLEAKDDIIATQKEESVRLERIVLALAGKETVINIGSVANHGNDGNVAGKVDGNQSTDTAPSNDV